MRVLAIFMVLLVMVSTPLWIYSESLVLQDLQMYSISPRQSLSLSSNLLYSKDLRDAIRSMVYISSSQIMFVNPDYTPIPDVMVWGFASCDSSTPPVEYVESLPDNQLVSFIRSDSKGKVVGVAKPDTSYGPPGSMAFYVFDPGSNKWSRLFSYRGPYYRLDPFTFVYTDYGYIVAGALREAEDEPIKPFVAGFSFTGNLKWIHVFNYPREYAGVFRHGSNVYVFIGNYTSYEHSYMEMLAKISPLDGSYTVLNSKREGQLFILKDSVENLYDTIGLIRSYKVDIYDPQANMWKTYSLGHSVYGYPWEGENLGGEYFFSYSDENRDVYLVVIKGNTIVEYEAGYRHLGTGNPFITHVNNNCLVIGLGEHPDKWGTGHILVYRWDRETATQTTTMTMTFTETVTLTTTKTAILTKTSTSVIRETVTEAKTETKTMTTTRTITETETSWHTLTTLLTNTIATTSVKTTTSIISVTTTILQTITITSIIVSTGIVECGALGLGIILSMIILIIVVIVLFLKRK